MSSTLTVRLDDELKQRLERLSSATHRSRSFLAAEAIRDFVELNEWQVGEIRQAVEEADQELFASEESVAESFQKWGA
ncbi:MAG: CopG family ribbon-helix-helix protein [Chromatiales bacterium]|nr:CopG family ribbon-helix-helix protein [Gammaproteobacteria bacterium]MBW6475928.1 CopG family ribbon-helix-helix protein [Chromatiales bacterium]